MKSFFSSLLGATLFVILLFFPGLVFEGAKMGLNLWFFTLVPTLLPFMVFSNILIQSRLIEHLLFLPGLPKCRIMCSAVSLLLEIQHESHLQIQLTHQQTLS